MSTAPAISFHCPRCNAPLVVPAPFAGKCGKCPSCHNDVRVPMATAPVAQVPAPPAHPSIPGGHPVADRHQAAAAIDAFLQAAQLEQRPLHVLRGMFADIGESRSFDDAYAQNSAAEAAAAKLFTGLQPDSRLVLSFARMDQCGYAHRAYAHSAVRVIGRMTSGADVVGYIAQSVNQEDEPHFLVFDFVEVAKAYVMEEAKAEAQAAFDKTPDGGEPTALYYVYWRVRPGAPADRWEKSGPDPKSAAAADAFVEVLRAHGLECWKELQLD